MCEELRTVQVRDKGPSDKYTYAKFHYFSTDHIEYESGPGPMPVAVVEYQNGQLDSVEVGRVKFLNPSK